MDLHKEIRLIRLEKGWSQTRLAEKMGCTKQYIHQIESGSASIEKMIQAAEAMGGVIEITLNKP